MLNQITKDTEVESRSKKNLTTFSIPIGLHPKDIDKIINVICKELDKGCKKTKTTIDSFNKELEYIQNLNSN